MKQGIIAALAMAIVCALALGGCGDASAGASQSGTASSSSVEETVGADGVKLSNDSSDFVSLSEAVLAHGFKPLAEEWWHFTLEDEPYPDTYFTFPVNSDSLQEAA